MKQYDYYTRFVQICSRMITKTDDYLDKEKIKKSNAARTQIRKLTKRMLEEKEQDIPEILHQLLKHENPVVQTEVAIICGQLGLYVDEFMPLMDHLQQNCPDSITRSNAAVAYDMQRARDIIAMLKKGGVFAAYKGVKLDEEIAASANALKIMNAEHRQETAI